MRCLAYHQHGHLLLAGYYNPAELEYDFRRSLEQQIALICAMENALAQGYTWHATCSTGFSIAEASNFFNNGMGLTVPERTEMYTELHKMADQACQQHPQLSKDAKDVADEADKMLSRARDCQLL